MPELLDFAPTVEALLEIEPEDLGLILIGLVHTTPGQQNSNFTISQFVMPIFNASVPGYPQQTHIRQAVFRAVAEAWQWLQTEGLIMPAPDQSNDWFCLTRRAHRLKNPADLNAYRKRGLLPTESLQPLLLEKVRPMFLRGDYDLATFEAFKQVEIRVRAAASLPADMVGVELMRTAFHPSTGALTDKTAVAGEKQALSDIFAGAIGHAKNPGSHRTVNLAAIEAAELIGLASYLLGMVEARVAKKTAASP
jgi:uncharacterized protein (TIGR02391 family)